ncbi:MAG TPA: exodeoxyribonuclease VII small subunit [Candidatus Saccharimonadales bacterium]|nr:exodeoxyribonuclease VII small subunit [Candidatus Saccharimonadales bacterium]
MAKAEKDYQTLSSELDRVLAQLQAPGVHVDEAVALYEEGLRLAGQLEKHLQQAENKIKQLKLASEQATESAL